MSFDKYQEEIKKAIDISSDEKLELFCHDVISRLQSFIDFDESSELSEDENKVLKNLREKIRNYPIEWVEVNKSLDFFTEIAEQEDDDFREFDGDFVEFLSALDSWRIFYETGRKDAVCAVSEYIMNLLDNLFVTEMDMKKWLTVPEINEEFNKQISFLRNNL